MSIKFKSGGTKGSFLKRAIMRVHWSTKVRVYVFGFLIIAASFTSYYLNAIKHDDRNEIDRFFGDQAEFVVQKLKKTDWGKTSRGRKVLSAFRTEEIRVIWPARIRVGEHSHYYINSDFVNGASSGVMTIENGIYRIYIGIYHESEIKVRRTRIIQKGEYVMPEDEFVHVLVDELVSRAQRGLYFVHGEASKQEELDAWNAAEEAVKAYYNNPYYFVDGLSASPPKYGPNNPFYRKIQ
jgi:hypothetical protein